MWNVNCIFMFENFIINMKMKTSIGTEPTLYNRFSVENQEYIDRKLISYLQITFIRILKYFLVCTLVCVQAVF